MTISSTTSRVDYTGTGSQSVYTFSFRIDDEDHLLVTKASDASPPVVTTLALTTDYTVSGVGEDTGGSITLVAGNLPSNYKLTIRRVLPLTQPTELGNQAPFFPETHEDHFDQDTMKDQQQQDLIDRSFKLPENEAGTQTNTTLPDAATRANKNFTFDSSGNPSASLSANLGDFNVTATGQAVIEAASASAARDAIGATSGKFGTAHIADKNITAALLASSAIAQIFQARLTLTTNVPVTVSNVTAATSVFVTPYGGDKISLYDGTDWRLYTLTQVTAAVPSTTNTMYDVFIYDNSGTLTLDIVAWTNDTTRATALATQNGVLVKTGALPRRYVGSFRTTGVSGNSEDSFTKRYVWNYYNRVPRAMKVTDTTNTWAYTLATFRQARASTANQVECIVGVNEVPVKARVSARVSHSAGSAKVAVGIGIDSTSVNSADIIMPGQEGTAGEPMIVFAEYNAYPGVGQHEIVWLEWSEATGTTTWQGDNGVADLTVQSGLVAEVMG